MAKDEAPGTTEEEKSIADQAEDLEGVENALGQMPIPGTGSSITLDAGGALPESSEVKMRGGSMPVEGEFDKGETIRFWVEARVAEVHFVDNIGKDGFVTGTVRRHILKNARTRRITEAEAEAMRAASS